MPGEGYVLSYPGDEGSGPQDGSEPRFLIVGQIVSLDRLAGSRQGRRNDRFPGTLWLT